MVQGRIPQEIQAVHDITLRGPLLPHPPDTVREAGRYPLIGVQGQDMVMAGPGDGELALPAEAEKRLVDDPGAQLGGDAHGGIGGTGIHHHHLLHQVAGAFQACAQGRLLV
ncbi:hypothetical protein RZS08_31010, partial [Arthrospira platensis SPKY1]|nr:hypothetical protein [Arthrospira platensis SPKY1]